MRTLKLGRISALVAVVAVCSIDAYAQPTYQPVPFAYNLRLQSELGSFFPEGELVLGDVPFSIPTSGFNYWSSRWSCRGGPPASPCSSGENPRTIDIDVGVFGVQEVHTIINTAWGQSGPTAYAWLDFYGSGGAHFRKDLIGGVDIRDHGSNRWTNTINNTTTINVFSVVISGTERRLDKQQIDLPSEFHTQTLDRIHLTDIGGERFSRAFLYGVTVATDGGGPPPPVEIPVVIHLVTRNGNPLRPKDLPKGVRINITGPSTVNPVFVGNPDPRQAVLSQNLTVTASGDYVISVSVTGYDFQKRQITVDATTPSPVHFFITPEQKLKPFWKRVRWGTGTPKRISYVIEPEGNPDSVHVQGIRSALDLWREIRASQGQPIVEFHAPGPGEDPNIRFIPVTEADPQGAPAWTRLVGNRLTPGVRFEIKFDTEFSSRPAGLDWYYGDPPPGTVVWRHPQLKWGPPTGINDLSFLYIMAHEIGHTLNFAEADPKHLSVQGIVDTLQYTVMAQQAQSIHWLGWGDVENARKQLRPSFIAILTCPVDLVIQDPLGRVVAKGAIGIPEASYVEADIDGDGDPDDTVTIPEPITGTYSISVLPEPGADPNEKVTLRVHANGGNSLLLDEVRIADLPTTPIEIDVDRAPPDLTLSVTPSELDGCDGGMVPVHIDLQVQDNADPNPEVALVTIEGAWTFGTSDIIGAAFGEDDREFQLRGTLNPDGSERVYTIHYVAVDATGNIVQASVTVTATDLTPPVITCPEDAVLECPADTSVAANGSAAAEDDCGGDVVITHQDDAVPGPGGTETITRTWRATDSFGNESTCDQIIQVVDTSAPTVEVRVDTNVLWSPDHTLEDVGLQVTVTDACDQAGADSSLEIEVYSDETETPDTGDGTGRHAPDAKDLPGGLRLRKERRARENGRVYLIIARAQDGSGNVGFGYCTVVVPHDQSQAGLDLVNVEVAASVQAVDAAIGGASSTTTIADLVAPLAYIRHGISESLGPHQ